MIVWLCYFKMTYFNTKLILINSIKEISLLWLLVNAFGIKVLGSNSNIFICLFVGTTILLLSICFAI